MNLTGVMRAVGFAGLGAVAVAAGPPPVRAGDLEWDNAPSLGTVSVRDRPRPEFQSEGIRIGNFILRPEVGYSLGWIRDGGGAANGSSQDLRHNITTSVELRSDWQRHFLDIAVQGNGIASQENSALRYLDGQVRVTGRIDIDHGTSLFGALRWQMRHEENVDEERPKGALQPTPFTVLQTEAGLQRTQGRIDWAVGGRYERTEYSGYTANDGTFVDQSFRSNSLIEPFARLGYRLSPGYRVFSELALDAKDNPGDGIVSRSSRGYRATGGVELEVTSLVKVTASLGYQTENFYQASLVDIAALVWSARVAWNVTPLMTISLAALRDVQTTSFGEASGRVDTSFSVKADYELLRNLIVSAEGRISLPDYIGINRQDEIFIGRIGAEYLMSKHWLLTVTAEHQQLTSTVADQGRTLDRVGVGVKYRF
jgi:hypothetical protein